jgi:hypothetical protein
MMDVKYVVFSAEDQQVTITADIAGYGQQQVQVPAFVVQLLPEDAKREHGSIKFQFIGDEIATSKDLFTGGATLNFNITKGD